jgi:AraC family transcriptional regulator
MSLTAKALWVIERHLFQAATLADIASACGVSRHHLAHAFARTTGRSVLAYLRGRRLTEAARTLAAGASDILDVAIGAGYGSHEAFTRAFRAQFGTTPEAVRRAASLDGIALVTAMGATDRTPLPIDPPRFEIAGTIHLIGLFRRHRFDHTRPIAQQWQEFIPEHAGIGPKLQPVPVGVVRALDDQGNFDYGCASEVTARAEAPTGLKRLRLAPQLYAVFTHRGHVSALDGSYGAVWDVWIPNSDDYAPVNAPSLERHLPTFDPRTGNGGVELWVPVIRR